MRTADRLVEAVLLDVWPDSVGVLVDFELSGKGGEENYRVLYRAIRGGRVSADELHGAVVEDSVGELIVGLKAERS